MSVPGGEVQRQIAGRYRVDGPLGSGAMGTVWSGFDDVLQRRVAIKELKIPDGMPSGEEVELRERMMREARALAGLSHPNVVTVFDVLDSGGEPLVVMELVPSRDLASAIGELGRLNRAQAAVVGFGTAAALRAAHRAGITHRDVKPGNVLISDDGRIKLTDFGIARNESDAPMTSAGLVLGSPAYIAPEVAAGQPVTPAADLWGLGATLFAAIEGRPPYDVNGDPVQTITEVVDGEVPRPSEPGPVADVIAGLMVKEPDDRMPLDEVRARLRPLLADPDDPIFPGSPD
ncbi:serine/threonine-protein kinase, partial [Pseudonocardia sp. KRD291]|uniref:serine/threonine-protein kinase n=1 Tax=Pseudonocardia sp. KRD291 TaxID=2792007 RepID=UPI0027E3891B